MEPTVEQDPEPPTRRGLVWDAPVRLVHWLLVLCVACAWLTRDARLLDLHAAAGYCTTFLVIFRIAWGFFGPPHARFASFTYSPRAALAYVRDAMRGAPRHFTGHNPAGSYAVYALLGLLALACLSGMVSIAGMFGLGPLPLHAPAPAIDFVREAHEWIAWILVGVIAAHVAGALWGGYVHRENLVASMVTGRKVLHGAEGVESPRRAPWAVAIAAALVLLVAGYLHFSGWDQGYRAAREATRASKPVADAAWQKECGSCHLAYSPALLPLRSWERTFKEQDAHFGEDLSLSAAAVARLRTVATAVPTPSWGAWKLVASAPADAAPLRISELPFWRHAHEDLPESAFKAPVSAGRHDCEACHVDAASGIFHPRMIQKPERGFSP
jgi:cytochrome b